MLFLWNLSGLFPDILKFEIEVTINRIESVGEYFGNLMLIFGFQEVFELVDCSANRIMLNLHLTVEDAFSSLNIFWRSKYKLASAAMINVAIEESRAIKVNVVANLLEIERKFIWLFKITRMAMAVMTKI